MRIQDAFSAAELDAITEATRAAEAHTASEILTVVVESCDSYEGGLWKAAALGSLLVSLASALVAAASESWSATHWVWISLPAFSGAALGYAAALWVPGFLGLMVPEEVLERRVARRAAMAFLDEGVFETRDRAGILILVGLFEHRVTVLRDTQAEEKIPPESWNDLMDRLTREIRKGRAAEALCRAIEDCGRLLELHGLGRRDDDVNELVDEPKLFDD